MNTDQRLRYFEDRISSSLRPNGQELRKAFSSEAFRGLFLELLTGSECRTVYVFCRPNGSLVVTSNPYSYALEKAVVFVKCKHVSKVVQENILEDILYFEYFGLPINHLLLTSKEVFLPLICVNGPEDPTIMDRVLDILHRMLGTIEILCQQITNNVVLPQPAMDVLADVSSDSNRHSLVMHILESSVVLWIKQIKIALQCDPITWLVNKYKRPGPLNERDFWKDRLTALQSLREQLSSLLAITILTHLEEAHSSFAHSFGEVYREVDKSILECQHILILLNTLHPWMTRLFLTDSPEETANTIPPILHTTFLIWMNSPYFGGNTTNFERLLRLLANDLVNIAKRQLTINLLEVTEEDVGAIIVALKICAAFRGAYLDYKDSSEQHLQTLTEANDSDPTTADSADPGQVGKGKSGLPVEWPVWISNVFQPLNTFMERCNDLHEVLTTVIHFQELKPFLSSSSKLDDSLMLHPYQGILYDKFVETLTVFTSQEEDLLVLSESATFEERFFRFRSSVKSLEIEVIRVFKDLWVKCSTTNSKFRLLQLYQGLFNRDIVQKGLFTECEGLLLDVLEEMKLYQEMLSRFMASPPLLKNLPSASSSMYWLCGFQQQLLVLAKQTQCFSSEMLATDNGWTARDRLGRLSKDTESCINSVKQKWISSVPTNLLDCLRTPVLIRGRSNELKLNISPTFLHILKESSYLIELVNDSDFPIVAKRALSESQSIDFYGKRSRLTVLVQEYNVIRESLTDVEKVLLQHKLTRIETLVEEGLSDILWSSEDLDEFISVATVVVCGEFAPLVRKLQETMIVISEIVKSWSSHSSLHLFGEELGSSQLEELSGKQKLACQNFETSLTSGRKRIKDMMEALLALVETGQDSPAWITYSNQVDVVVVNGVRKAFLSGISHLLHRVSLFEQGLAIPPLVTVKLELLGNEISFTPPLNQISSELSVSESVKEMMYQYLNVCANACVLKSKEQHGSTSEILLSDSEINSGLSKVIAHLESSSRKCRSLRNKFLPYSFIWEDDVIASFNLFLKGRYSLQNKNLNRPQTVRASARSTQGRSRPATATTALSGTMGTSDWTFIFPESQASESSREHKLPTLDDFDMQIAVFEGFLEKVNSVEELVTVGWIIVDMKPIKHCLQSLVLKWKNKFTSHIIDRVCDVLDTLNTVLLEVEPQVEIVSGLEDDWSLIKNIVSVFNKVNSKGLEVDDKFGAVHRSVQMLQKYKCQIPSEAKNFLSTAPQRWSALKKKMGIAKQRISPKVQANVDLVRQEFETFNEWFEQLRQVFNQSDCLKYGTSEEVAITSLEACKARLLSQQERAKDLEMVQELLEKNLFNFTKLTELANEFEVLENLLHLCRVFKQQHSDWKCHRWCDTDTAVLLSATALQLDQLKNLPDFCSEWDVYTKLIDVIIVLQNTLPVINDFLRSSLRTRHWKQILRLALPRQSGSTGSVTSEKLKMFTLRELMELSFSDHAAEIRSIAERADKDLAVEMAIKTFEEVWLSRVFELKPAQKSGRKSIELIRSSFHNYSYNSLQTFITFIHGLKHPILLPPVQGSGKRRSDSVVLSTTSVHLSFEVCLLENIDEVVVIVNEHQTSLQALLGTNSASSFMEDLNKWRKILQTIEAVLKVWKSVQDLWYLLQEVCMSLEMQERLPGAMLTFQMVDKDYCELLQQVEKNANVMFQCCQEDQLTVLNKMHNSLKECQNSLLAHTRTYQDSVPWFLFLPPDDVLSFVCNGTEPAFLSSNIQWIIPSVHMLQYEQVEHDVKIVAVKSRGGDSLRLTEMVSTDSPIETILTLLMQRISQSLRSCCSAEIRSSRLAEGNISITNLKSFLQSAIQGYCPRQIVHLIVGCAMRVIVEQSPTAESVTELTQSLTSFLSSRRFEVGSGVSVGTLSGRDHWICWAVLFSLYYRDVVQKHPANERSIFIDSFEWFAALKYAFGSDSNQAPLLQTGDATIPYGFQYTGQYSQLTLSVPTVKSMFSLLKAKKSSNIAFCYGQEESLEPQLVLLLSEMVGYVIRHFVCSEQVSLLDMTDIMRAACLTGSWIFWNDFDKLKTEVYQASLYMFHSISDALRRKKSEVTLGSNVTALSSHLSPFFSLSVSATTASNPLGSFCKVPPYIVHSFRLVSLHRPKLEDLLPAIFTSMGFSYSNILAENVLKVVDKMPLIKGKTPVISQTILTDVIGLASKHQEMLANTGSLSSLYTDTADYLRAYSEAYLQKRVEDVTNEAGQDQPEVHPDGEVHSRLITGSPTIENEHLTEGLSEEPAAISEGLEQGFSIRDGTHQLTEQFAIMLALKDSFLPAYGGARTELGKEYVALLGSVFNGLAIEKVISQELEVLQRAECITSHPEILDSVRESRAASVLRKGISPSLARGPLSLEEAISSACRILEYEPTTSFQTKVIQLIQLIQAHKLIAVSGTGGCGKTACIAVANEAMHILGYNVTSTRICVNDKCSVGGYWKEGQWRNSLLATTVEEIQSSRYQKQDNEESVSNWLVIDGHFSVSDLLSCWLPGNGVLRMSNKKSISLPSEFCVIVEQRGKGDLNIPVVQVSDSDVDWRNIVALKIKKSSSIPREQAKQVMTFFCEVFTKIDGFMDRKHVKFDTKVVAITSFKLLEVFLGAYKSCPLEVCTVYAVSWTMRHYLIGCLATKFDAFIEKEFGDVTKLSSGTSIFSTLLSNNSEVLQPLTDVLQKALSARYSVCGQPFIPTAQSVTLTRMVTLSCEHGIPVLVHGRPGSGKSFCVRHILSTAYGGNLMDIKPLIINMTEHVTTSMLANTLLEHMTWMAGNTYVPAGARQLVVFIDNIHKVLTSANGVYILDIIHQHITDGGFHHPDSHQWYHVSNVTYIISCDNDTRFDYYFQHHFLRFHWLDYNFEDLHFIFCEMLKSLDFSSTLPQLSSVDIINKMVDVTLDIHKQMQHLFSHEDWCNYSLCDLSKLFQRILCHASDITNEQDFLSMWQHQCYWTYTARLPSDADLTRYQDIIVLAIKKHLSNIPGFDSLLSNQALVVTPPGYRTGKGLIEVKSGIKELQHYFNEQLTEAQRVAKLPGIPFCGQYVREACYLLEVLNSPFQTSHCLLVGFSNPEPLTHVVSVIMSSSLVHLSDLCGPRLLESNFDKYSLTQFRGDLIAICTRAGVKGERLILHLLDDDMMEFEHFFVYLELLMNDCAINCIFSEEEKDHVITSIRGHVTQAGIEFSTSAAWDFFLKNIRKNLRIVVSVTRDPPQLLHWISQCRPTLLRMMNMLYHRPWRQADLLSVAELELEKVNGIPAEVKKKICHVLSSFHTSLLVDLPLESSMCVNNWAYKCFVERYVHSLSLALERNREESNYLSKAVASIVTAENKLVSLEKQLQQETIMLEEKSYACMRQLRQIGQDTAISAEHNKLLLKLKERMDHLELIFPEYEHAYEVSVDKTAQLVRDTKELVHNMDRASLADLRSLHEPPECIQALLAAVIVIVKSPNADFTWVKGAKRLMANLDRFNEMLSSFDEPEQTSQTILQSLVQYEEVLSNRQQFRDHSPAADDLHQWVLNIIRYHEMLETKVCPLQAKLDQVRAFLKEFRHKLGNQQDKVADFTESLKSMRDGLEEFVVDKSLYEEHMEYVKHQLEDVKDFTQVLSEAKNTWARQLSNSSNAHLKRLGGLAITEGFTVYLARFPHHFRKQCLQELWPNCLERCGIELNWPCLSVQDIIIPITGGSTEASLPLLMSLYLADPLNIIELSERGYQGEAILHLLTAKRVWQQCVLFIDPEELSVHWLQDLFGDQLVLLNVQQKGLSFYSALERALTEGQPTVIHHVYEALHPSLIASLLFSRVSSDHTGEQLHFCGKNIAVHPNFSLFLVSSQPLSLQATRVLSACTVIDLTPYKAELYSFLAPAVRESEGGLLMLAEGYSKVMKDAIGCLSSSDQCSSSYVALMGQVQEKIKLMHKAQQDLSQAIKQSTFSRLVESEALQPDGVSAILYSLMVLLSSSTHRCPLKLTEWVEMTSSQTDKEALGRAALVTGSKFLTGSLWNCLAAFSIAVNKAKSMPELQAMDIGEAVSSALHNQIHTLCFSTHSLTHIIEQSKETSVPMILAVENQAMFSSINLVILVQQVQFSCSGRTEILNPTAEGVEQVIRAINELPSQSSCLVDLLTVPEECVSDLASKIKECAARGIRVFILCQISSVPPVIVADCSLILLNNLRLHDSSLVNTIPPTGNLFTSANTPLLLMQYLLEAAGQLTRGGHISDTFNNILLRLCAMHVHLIQEVSSRKFLSKPFAASVVYFLNCIDKVCLESKESEIGKPEHHMNMLYDYIEETYSIMWNLNSNCTVTDLMKRDIFQVGNREVDIGDGKGLQLVVETDVEEAVKEYLSYCFSSSEFLGMCTELHKQLI